MKSQIRLTEPVVGKEEAEAVRRVLESGWLAEGEETRQFEHEIAEYVGAKYAVAVANCTVALMLCLRALEITGRVATPAFGHPATVRAILNAGCTPVFVDVDLTTYNWNPRTVSFTGDTMLPTVPVAWGGRPLNHSAYVNEVVTDGACALGSGEGHPYTTCFSFHPRKLITTGEGGIVTTNDPELAETLRSLKNFGYGNYKFDDIRASIGRAQLKRLPEIILRRVSMARVYDDLLSEVSGVVSPESDVIVDSLRTKRHTYQTYAVYLQKGDRYKIIEKLKRQGIETQIGAYFLPWLDFKKFNVVGELKNASLLARNLLALPMSYSISDEDQKFVVEALKNELYT